MQNSAVMAAQAAFFSNTFQVTSVDNQNKSKCYKWGTENYIHLVYHIPHAKKFKYVLCIHTFCRLLFNSTCFPTFLLFILQMLF